MADKVLQMAVAKILEAIYEQDFLVSSFGYRPGIDAVSAKVILGPGLGHCSIGFR